MGGEICCSFWAKPEFRRKIVNDSSYQSENNDIHIYCDGKELPLVAFVASLFYDTFAAMTANLKGAETAKEVTIKLAKP